MKTPMQELLEWVRATLPMDLETPQMIEKKIESMLEKEKQELKDAFDRGASARAFDMGASAWASGRILDDYYNKTYGDKKQ